MNRAPRSAIAEPSMHITTLCRSVDGSLAVARDLDATLAAQDGLVHRRQLATSGVSRFSRRNWLERGLWRELLPGVYLTTPGPATTHQRLIAAILYGGEHAQLTGVEALRIHGLQHLPDDPYVRVCVPHARQLRPAGFVRIHRTRRPDPTPLACGPLRVCRAARAIADEARIGWCATPDQIRDLIREALDRNLATPAQLVEELDHGARQHSAQFRWALTAVSRT
jgi:hypothetical protein